MLSKFKSYQAAKVDEIRKSLIDDFNYTQRQVDAIKGKHELIELHKTCVEKYNKSLALAQDIELSLGESLPKIEGVAEIIPTPGDENWTDWVLDQLDEDEIFNQMPKADGLRRLIEKLIGTIIGQYTDVITSPSSINGSYATVKHKIDIKTRDNEFLHFEGAADVAYNTLVKPFNNHLVATAETKAEARAFKRALKIKTVTAEEIENTNTDSVTENNKDIDDTQIRCIDLIAGRLNIDVEKFLVATVNKTDIKTLTWNEGLVCSQLITKMQIDGVPENYLKKV